MPKLRSHPSFSRAIHGHIPDPIPLSDAARLWSADPAASGASEHAILGGLIAAFWRGELERPDGSSVVFTVEPPENRVESPADAGPDWEPEGLYSVDSNGNVYKELDEDDPDEPSEKRRVLTTERRRVPWTRSELLEALRGLSDAVIDQLLDDPHARELYQAMAARPLSDYSELARRTYLERLHIGFSDLATWCHGKKLPVPAFLAQADPTPDHPGARPTRGPGRPPESGSYARNDAPLVDEMRRQFEAGAAPSPWAAAEMLAERAAGAGTQMSKAKRLRKRYSAKFGG